MKVGSMSMDPEIKSPEEVLAWCSGCLLDSLETKEFANDNAKHN